MASHYIPPCFELKMGIHGLGIFAKEDFKKGSLLFKMKGKIVSQPTRTSVQVGNHKHIEDQISGYINHSCSPNAQVNHWMRAFVCLKDIHKGEELTFNYNQNEESLACPFECECCHQKVVGKKRELVK